MPTIHLSTSAKTRTFVLHALISCAGLGVWQPEAFAQGPECPGPYAICAQCPDFTRNGVEEEYFAYSDVELDVSLADNFTLQTQNRITRIRWWGTYLVQDAGCGPPGPGDFTVLLWRNADGNPAGPDPLTIPAHAVTRSTQAGWEVPAALGPAAVVEYELTFEGEGLTIEGGETYWLEIRNHPPFCNWVWLTAPGPPGDGSSRQRSPSTDSDWSAPSARGFDLAFALFADPPGIPAASQWGLVALALAVLATGTVVLARKRLPSPAPPRDSTHS